MPAPTFSPTAGTDTVQVARGLEVRVDLADPGQPEEGRLGWVDAIEDLVLRVARGAGLDGDAAFFLGVAAREAVVNAIRHGSEDEGGCRIAVTLRITEGGTLVLTVRDRGKGFDPKRLPDPLCDANLCRSSGRGVFYMRRFADRVRFSFPRRGGTLVRIEKKLPEGAL